MEAHGSLWSRVNCAGGYRGNAGDSLTASEYSADTEFTNMTSADWMSFSTYDNDNDKWEEGNCASRVTSGAFWYNQCGMSYVNSGTGSAPGFSWLALPIGSTLADKQLLVSRWTLSGC